MYYELFYQSVASLNSRYFCVVCASVHVGGSCQFSSWRRSERCTCVLRSRYWQSQTRIQKCQLIKKLKLFYGKCELQEYDSLYLIIIYHIDVLYIKKFCPQLKQYVKEQCKAQLGLALRTSNIAMLCESCGSLGCPANGIKIVKYFCSIVGS